MRTKTDSFAGQRAAECRAEKYVYRNNGLQTRHIPNARPGVAAYAAPPRSRCAQAAYGRERKETFPERKKTAPNQSRPPLHPVSRLASAFGASNFNEWFPAWRKRGHSATGWHDRALPFVRKGRSRLRGVRSCVMSCLEKGRAGVSFSALGMGQGTLSFSIKYPDPLFNF